MYIKLGINGDKRINEQYFYNSKKYMKMNILIHLFLCVSLCIYYRFWSVVKGYCHGEFLGPPHTLVIIK